MTTKQLLSSNSYIQYPKFLGFYIGVNESILLSALCDKDSWCEFNVENYDGWFYFLREEIYLETGLTERQQRSAILKLEDLNIVGTKRQGIPAKVYYYINTDALEFVLNNAYESYKAHKTQMLQNVTSCPNKTVTTCTSENVISTINKNNIKELNKSTGAGAPSKNHSQIYKKKETLNDDLCSGKDIDEQTKVRKKESKYDKCLVEIDKRDFSDEEKLLLREHIQWSFNSADPNRNNEPRKYAKRLDELLKLKGNRLQIIQQSIEKQWHCFYEYKETSNTRTYETKQDKIKIRDLEEAKAAMKKKDEEGVEVF